MLEKMEAPNTTLRHTCWTAKKLEYVDSFCEGCNERCNSSYEQCNSEVGQLRYKLPPLTMKLGVPQGASREIQGRWEMMGDRAREQIFDSMGQNKKSFADPGLK